MGRCCWCREVGALSLEEGRGSTAGTVVQNLTKLRQNNSVTPT